MLDDIEKIERPGDVSASKKKTAMMMGRHISCGVPIRLVQPVLSAHVLALSSSVGYWSKSNGQLAKASLAKGYVSPGRPITIRDSGPKRLQ